MLGLERCPALKEFVLLVRQLDKVSVGEKLRQRDAEGLADDFEGSDARLIVAVEYIGYGRLWYAALFCEAVFRPAAYFHDLFYTLLGIYVYHHHESIIVRNWGVKCLSNY